MKAVIK